MGSRQADRKRRSRASVQVVPPRARRGLVADNSPYRSSETGVIATHGNLPTLAAKAHNSDLAPRARRRGDQMSNRSGKIQLGRARRRLARGGVELHGSRGANRPEPAIASILASTWACLRSISPEQGVGMDASPRPTHGAAQRFGTSAAFSRSSRRALPSLDASPPSRGGPSRAGRKSRRVRAIRRVL